MTGLGILKSAGARMPLQPTNLGENFAKALDKRLRRSGGYDRLLGTLDEVRASEREASDLYRGWSISTPSAEDANYSGRPFLRLNQILSQGEDPKSSPEYKLWSPLTALSQSENFANY